MAEMRKVLVADDEPEVAEVIGKMLSRSGFDVLTAHSGKEAVAMAAENRPDVVLLDIRMPGMDGVQACGALREDPSNDRVPIIMLTACGGESDIVRALEGGADDYLVKPVDLEAVLKKVRGLLAVAGKGTLPSQAFKRKTAADQEDSGKG